VGRDFIKCRSVTISGIVMTTHPSRPQRTRHDDMDAIDRAAEAARGLALSGGTTT
jgi:hypothetical protein